MKSGCMIAAQIKIIVITRLNTETKTYMGTLSTQFSDFQILTTCTLKGTNFNFSLNPYIREDNVSAKNLANALNSESKGASIIYASMRAHFEFDEPEMPRKHP